MKMIKKGLAAIFMLCCFIPLMMLSASPAAAASDILPTSDDNLTVSLRSSSGLVATDDGYMRVFFDGKKIGIEYYDDSFQIQSKKSLDMELNWWGGFFAGSDAYYLVEGQANKDESDTAEVIRVIKYDMDWNRQGAAKITGNPELFGGEVRYPFDVGCVEMAEHNGNLYIVTGHEGYVDPKYKQGHQGFLMLTVDETSMTGQIADSDLWHSFAQYITGKDSDLYVLEQSEGSRYTKLTRYNAENLEEKTFIPVFKYGGLRTSAWSIPCYASVDGVAVSSDHVLGLGTSIDQSKYDSYTSSMAENIYLTVTKISDFSENTTTIKWLTNYNGHGKRFTGTKITKVNDNRFLVSWGEKKETREVDTDDGLSANILHYLFIDGEGNVISEEFTASAPISDCQPIVKGSKIVYYASNTSMVNFYSINTETGMFNKQAYRIAGENAVWELNEGKFIVSGTGAMHPAFVGSYYSDIWGPIKQNVQKLVIREGITDISKMAFAFFRNLTEVELESGVKSIGEKAFFGCDALEKITIPASVTSIGEDFLWTGSYWTHDKSHVVKATIHAPDNSYAMKYAKENGIRYVNSDKAPDNPGNKPGSSIRISSAKVSGLKETYAYNGNWLRPNVTVKLGNKTLKKGTDYTVTYANNKNTGQASVTITGKGRYKGTIKKTFCIIPRKAAAPKVSSPKARTIKVTWKKDSQASGYQLQYAKNAGFTKDRKNIIIGTKATVSKKISNLAKGKNYYVRICAYKDIKGKIYYGSWSKAAKVKCK